MAFLWNLEPSRLPLAIVLIAVILYLARLNQLLKATPSGVQKLSGPRWTPERLNATYEHLRKSPIDYRGQIPPRLDRRYIITGGAGKLWFARWITFILIFEGLVGGYIVLQLLARGTPPENIRIIDIQRPQRKDMLTGPPAEVDFVQANITSVASVNSAFGKAWDASVSSLPLTVFHTAAVIIPSDRSKYVYDFPEAVNVRGTKNVLAASRRAGADVFSSTSSASISIRPVKAFVAPWATEPKDFWQILDEADFSKPLREHEEFFGNYPASKAVAERLVCAENDASFRTGCIRPGNGVYGNPTDNTVGGPLSKKVFPTWVPHIVQSFVHGANVAIAHLQHEAVLINRNCSQSGRPFVVTDPNPPITYGDLYNAISTLSVHPLYVVVLPPVMILLLSHFIEWYNILPYRYPLLRRVLPEIKGEARFLQPGLFSICTHLVASDLDARKDVSQGGLGYRGVLTTIEGMAQEVLEWNREHLEEKKGAGRKMYTTSVSLAKKIQKLGIMDGELQCNE